MVFKKIRYETDFNEQNSYEELLEDDEISSEEMGFMAGWEKAGENNMFEDSKGKLWMAEELDELSEWEVQELGIHLAA